MSSLDYACSTKPVIIQGEDKSLAIRLVDGKTSLPYDISAATEVAALFRNTDSTILTKLLSTSGISIVSGPGGAINVLLTAANTKLLALSDIGSFSSFEVHVTIAGKINYIQLINSIQVIASLFPTP
jgi:hypothetical protein